MKTKNLEIELDLLTAREWYAKGGKLREFALKAWKVEELEELWWEKIKTWSDLVAVLSPLDKEEWDKRKMGSGHHSLITAQDRLFALTLVRKYLNRAKDGLDYVFGPGGSLNKLWFPEMMMVKDGGYRAKQYRENPIDHPEVFSFISGPVAWSVFVEVMSYDSSTFEGNYFRPQTLLFGCREQEIAEHFGRYFGKDIALFLLENSAVTFSS